MRLVRVVLGWVILMILLPWGLVAYLYHVLAHMTGLPCWF